jgi:hypothetical protein
MNILKEGTVYTPEKLAKYIAKTAIEKYLCHKIKSKFSCEISNLNKLFKMNNKKNIEKVEYIFEVLQSVKILDPAVGSGHFIIAALKYLESCYVNLRRLGIINWSNYEIRESIILNSLFGVDIEIDAIKVTKRRLLSTLEDLVNVNKIIPNIDSHFKVGNAIVGFLRQSEIKFLVSPTNLNSCFYEEIKKVFETHKNLKKIELIEREKKELISKLKPFHWFQEFPGIIEKGGFDIIIENPPYISNKQLSSLEKAIYQNRYKTPKGLMNTFGIFIERSIELCHSSSIISSIIHKNIIRSNNYALLRKYLLEHTTIEEIIDLGAGAFQSVTAETVILILKTKIPTREHKISIKTNLFNQNHNTNKEVLLNQIFQKTYLKQENYNFNLDLQYKELEIINYIKKTKDCNLIKYFKAKTCIATGDNGKFLTRLKIDQSYKKTLKGKNIGRFHINFDGLYVCYDTKALHRARDETIFQKPEKLIMQTISSNLTVAYDNKQYYPLSTCIAIIPKAIEDNSFSIKYLLLLMNSNLLNFYYDFVFNLGAHLTTEISVYNINRLPLRSLQDYGLFNILTDYMNQMNENKASRDDNKKYIAFLDDLINNLIYEIFFFDKFQSDGLNTNLINLVSQHLINRNLDSISLILTSIKNMQDDGNILNQVENIKNHPWIEIIEGYFKN